MDKEYIPLVGAAITGGATLLGVAVAAFVLRYHHRSQRNPVRLELYKKQLEGIGKIAKHIRQAQVSLYVLVKAPNLEMVGQDNDALLDDYRQLLAEYDVYLPSELNTAAMRYFANVAAVLQSHKNERNNLEAVFKDEVEAMHELRRLCRKFAGTDVLTDGMEPMSEFGWPNAIPLSTLVKHVARVLVPQRADS